LSRKVIRSSGGGETVVGAWRGLVRIVESIDPRPYTVQPAVYGRLMITVICMSDATVY
jgi:hypothetical protein